MIPTSTQMKISLAARPASNWQAVVVFVTQGAKAAEGAAAAAVGGERLKHCVNPPPPSPNVWPNTKWPALPS
jgi:hypothetical protein